MSTVGAVYGYFRLIKARLRGFNLCETINLYYNGLITVLCRGKEVPRQGVAVFCLNMSKHRIVCIDIYHSFSRAAHATGFIMLAALLLPAAAFSQDAGMSRKAVKTPAVKTPGPVVPADELAAVEKGLKGQDFKIRREALKKLGGIKDPRKAALLKEYLGDRDPEIRERSARLLGRSGDKAAYKTLMDTLSGAGDGTRLPLMDALGDLADRRAVVVMAGLLAHPDRNTRWKAAEVLGRLKAEDGVEPLLGAARSDKDEMVRRAAVESLGKINTEKALTALNGLKAGPDKKIAGWAENVLKAAAK